MSASFKPYVSSKKKIPEWTIRSTILGVFLGLIFAVGNAYLGLKTGTTVSASIPAAITSMTLLRLFYKKTTILENNIVQTIATVGEGLAAGVVFTIPALIFLGEMPSLSRIFMLSVLGGILGILFMIPMRRYVIVEEHGVLPFPEGTACAAILEAGEEKSHSSAILAIWAFVVAAIYKVCSSIFFFWLEVPRWIIKPFQSTEFSMDATPAILGVGYIIGPRIASLMFTGGAISWWVIIPLIKMFGSGSTIIHPSTIPVSMMSAQDIWSNYVRYIGVGAVITGSLISLIKILPILYKTIHNSAKELKKGLHHEKKRPRTDQDISMAWLILGPIAIVIALLLTQSLNLFTILLLVVLAFVFVGITSITVGIVGSTSNPASGMTITVLLITCLVFLGLGWTEKIYLIAAITMGCVANIAITLASTTSQDLKTGFLLGATPKSQQLAEIVGIILPAIALGGTIHILNSAYHLGSIDMPAPQATMLAMIAKGVIAKDLPLTLVLIGILMGLVIWVLKIPILPFALGLYLPLSLSTATMVGGLIAKYVHSHERSDTARHQGMLLSSGLIGGDACLGVIIALLSVLKVIPIHPHSLLPKWSSLVIYLILALALGHFAAKDYSVKKGKK